MCNDLAEAMKALDGKIFLRNDGALRDFLGKNVSHRSLILVVTSQCL